MSDFENNLRVFRDARIHMDSCNNDPKERIYDWGLYSDLCGMTPEEYMSATPFFSGDGSGSVKSKNTITISTTAVTTSEGSTGYEIILTCAKAPTADVTVEFTVDDIPTGATVTAGSKKTSTGIILPTKYATITNFTGSTSDETYTYTYTNGISEGNFNLTYKVDGVVYTSFTVTYGTSITPIDAPEKEGYTFSGWQGFPEDGKMPEKDVIVTGTFAVVSYTITFKNEDGVVLQETKVNYGTKPVYTGLTPTKASDNYYTYEFIGWTPAIVTASTSATYTASYSSVTKYYTVRFVDWDDSVLSEKDYKYGETVVEYREKESGPPVTRSADSKYTYEFAEWNPTVESIVTGNATYKATYSETPQQYTLKYQKVVDDVTSDITAYTMDYGETIIAESVPKIDGHSCSGWSEKIPETMPDHDVTITAVYSTNIYEILFQDYDATELETDLVKYGDMPVYSKGRPTRDATAEYIYEFDDWDPSIVRVVGNAMYRAKYTETKRTYSIYYHYIKGTEEGDLTDKTVNNVEWGTPITLEDPFSSLTGYEKEITYFNDEGQLSEKPTEMPTSDLTVVCEYVLQSYNLNYYVDGVLSSTTKVNYGSTIDPITEPTKTGYKFSGWQGFPEDHMMPDHDVDVTGTFEAIPYTLKYELTTDDGDSATTQTYTSTTQYYGDKLTAIDAPEKEGYTFSGWEDLPTTMPDHDVTVTGKLTIITYHVNYSYVDVSGNTHAGTVDVKHGHTLVLPTVDVPDGYTFEWDIVQPLVVTGPVEDITGTFTPKEYTLKVIVSGTTYPESSVTYGNALVNYLPTEEELKKDYYTYKWYYSYSGKTEPVTTMPASDLTMECKYSAITYTLTFNVDGTEAGVDSATATISGTCEDTVTVPTSLNKEGFTIQWDETIPTKFIENKTITGKYVEVAETSTVYYGAVLNDTIADYTTLSSFEASEGETSVTFTIPASAEYIAKMDEANEAADEGDEDLAQQLAEEAEELRDNYKYPFYILMPANVINSYSYTIVNGLGADGGFTVYADKTPTLIDGVEYTALRAYNNDSQRADDVTHNYDYKITLTKK